MIRYKSLLLTFSISLLVILTACNSSSKNELKDLRICPQCNMELPKSNIYTSKLAQKSDTYWFDDIGCMVLWSKENNIDLNTIKSKVFSNDTKKYIDSSKAFYMIDEKTPMSYGFGAYEKKQENSLNFDKVIIKMLRGEHMANPKIRKQILGY